MDEIEKFVERHTEITRRYLLGLGVVGAAGCSLSKQWAEHAERHPELAEAVAKLEYLTKDGDFRTLGRGSPKPHTLPPEKLREVGLHRDTWSLEIVADPESDSQVDRPLTKEAGTSLDWQGLMKLADKHAVRFLHVTSCTNVAKPFGMGLWEGVPLREVVWMAKPVANVRRVFYYGYHNDDPEQRFQSSLPVGRVLEDPPGEHPVILCYKLNGQWLSPARGGPVRIVVPGEYGNKSVKWIQRIVLTNSYQANDTYALKNNDTVSRIKTDAQFVNVPERSKVGEAVPITGLAQVGVSGLDKVQYWVHPLENPLPADDPYFATADWKDAEILPPPEHWGGELPDGKLPEIPGQIDPATGNPITWPLPNTIVHWATLLTKMAAGKYEVRCRTIDGNGIAQPMPRPFQKSGKNAIQKVQLVVEG
jgi:DMSO/TMAO reductase YedYZ molybdopterin-dependent catalytic subunit